MVLAPPTGVLIPSGLRDSGQNSNTLGVIKTVYEPRERPAIRVGSCCGAPYYSFRCISDTD